MFKYGTLREGRRGRCLYRQAFENFCIFAVPKELTPFPGSSWPCLWYNAFGDWLRAAAWRCYKTKSSPAILAGKGNAFENQWPEALLFVLVRDSELFWRSNWKPDKLSDCHSLWMTNDRLWIGISQPIWYTDKSKSRMRRISSILQWDY